MTHTEITQAIMSTTFTQDQINDLIRVVKFAQQRLGQATLCQLQVGDNVSFVGRGGRTVTGVVMKTAIKNVSVKTIDGTVWRVGASLLTRIADEEEYV
jgi:small-conductance mechanosensitive channel